MTDNITVAISATDKVVAAAKRHLDYIKKETLATAVDFGESGNGFQREWDVNGEPAKLAIKR